MKWMVTAFILLALAAYTLPWLINPGIGLTFGAYDLAEWTSLHPEVRFGTPELLTPLLLRLPLVCIAIMLAFSAGRFNTLLWWLNVGIALVVLGVSLPPLEFVTSAREDPNYLQQFVLTVIASGFCLAGFSSMAERFTPYPVILTTVIGIAAGLIGLEQANYLMIGFSMPVQRGIGPFLFIILCGFVTLIFAGSAQDGEKIHHPAE